MKKILLLISMVAGCGMYVEPEQAVRAVENQGFSNARVLEKHIFFVGWHGCGEHDSAEFDVEATNPAGKRVNVIVCAGWPFKGATVRSK